MLLRIGQRTVLVADDGSVVTSNGTPVSATLAVPLAGSRLHQETLHGRRVTVSGELKNRLLVVDAIELLDTSSERIVPGVGMNDENFAAGYDSPTVAELRIPAERDLLESGILIDA
ncbi:hypothetical protein [Jidongwangia harbinensis]|uniref:hypothetical protein n=1 Tax=Jidongwangia harbinensis TaxID=2878561 RepID=UPI001CD9FED0|nr:hypothetical protein [Jidongwangia harbinensis]MCA2211811.1 hypothetical protein [Jidongwangia harbinensis]